MTTLLEAARELRATCDELEASQARALATIRAVAKQVEGMGQSVGGGNSRVTIFSQRDERWSGVALGGGALTIGQAGCLLTCAASLLCDAGFATDPAQLNGWMKARGGFVQGNIYVWSAINTLGVVRFADLVDCPGPEDTPIERIRNWIYGGGFAIAQVDFAPGGLVDQHWVRIASIDESSGRIMDPWEMGGDLVDLCPRYGANPSVAIWRVGLYGRA